VHTSHTIGNFALLRIVITAADWSSGSTGTRRTTCASREDVTAQAAQRWARGERRWLSPMAAGANGGSAMDHDMNEIPALTDCIAEASLLS
jgi:hypothetical protein